MSFSEVGASVDPLFTEQITYISPRVVDAALPCIDTLKVVREAMKAESRGESELPPETSMYWNNADVAVTRSLIMPGAIGRDTTRGIKIIGSSLGNRDRGLPRAQGIVVLLDNETGWPAAILAGSAISATRTAAVSLLAIQTLAVDRSLEIGFLGAGRIASAVSSGLGQLSRSISRISVFDVDAERARDFIGKTAYPAAMVSSAREVCISSDVVVAATTASEGYVDPTWLPPGSLFINLSLDDLTAAAILASDRVFVDSWALISDDKRRLLGRLIASGDFVPSLEGGDDGRPNHPTTSTLGELFLCRCSGRNSNRERIVINPFGMSILDVALAQEVLLWATARELDVKLGR